MAGLVSTVCLVVMPRALMHTHSQRAALLVVTVLLIVIAADLPGAGKRTLFLFCQLAQHDPPSTLCYISGTDQYRVQHSGSFEEQHLEIIFQIESAHVDVYFRLRTLQGVYLRFF